MTVRNSGVRLGAALTTFLIAIAISPMGAQDRLRAMPGYDQYQKMQPLLQGTFVSGAIAPVWGADGQSFTYSTAGKTYRFDLGTMKATEIGDASAAPPAAGARGNRGAGRGAPPPAAAQG